MNNNESVINTCKKCKEIYNCNKEHFLYCQKCNKKLCKNYKNEWDINDIYKFIHSKRPIAFSNMHSVNFHTSLTKYISENF